MVGAWSPLRLAIETDLGKEKPAEEYAYVARMQSEHPAKLMLYSLLIFASKTIVFLDLEFWLLLTDFSKYESLG